MLWVVVDGGSWWRLFDDQDGCEWVNVSFGTGPPVYKLWMLAGQWKQVGSQGRRQATVAKRQTRQLFSGSYCKLSRTVFHILLYVTHTHPFNGPLSRTTQVSRYQKGKTNLDFTEARDSEWQWLQLGRMQVCNSLQPDNHASTSPLSFLQAGCPSCRPTNSVKALKALCYCCKIVVIYDCIV